MYSSFTEARFLVPFSAPGSLDNVSTWYYPCNLEEGGPSANYVQAFGKPLHARYSSFSCCARSSQHILHSIQPSRRLRHDVKATDLRIASWSVVEQKNTEPHGIHRVFGGVYVMVSERRVESLRYSTPRHYNMESWRVV